MLLYLEGVVRAGFADKVKFEQRPEGSGAANHVAIGGKKVLARENSSGTAYEVRWGMGWSHRAFKPFWRDLSREVAPFLTVLF